LQKRLNHTHFYSILFILLTAVLRLPLAGRTFLLCSTVSLICCEGSSGQRQGYAQNGGLHRGDHHLAEYVPARKWSDGTPEAEQTQRHESNPSNWVRED
jgi:hypothetical protein